MSRYHHLNITERENLYKLYLQGAGIREMARQLGRSPSTISRELGRVPGDYRPSVNQKAYHQKRARCIRRRRLLDTALNQDVRFYITHLYWSPEQVCERLRLEHGSCIVGTSTIYRALDNGTLRDTIRFYLRKKYKVLGKARKAGKKCFEQSIDLRPAEAADRAAIGHWEADTMLGCKEPDRLVTLVDRKSRYVLIARVTSARAEEVNETIIGLLKGHPAHTLTFDQGTEFASARELHAVLGSEVFFAHPHSPWERPTNENTNGLIRQFVPRRKSISELSDKDVSDIAAKLNLRPRKCLGWRAPYELLSLHLLHFT